MSNGTSQKVIILGNVGNDPEVRYLPNGGAVCNISVATSETWKDKNTGKAVTPEEKAALLELGKGVFADLRKTISGGTVPHETKESRDGQ